MDLRPSYWPWADGIRPCHWDGLPWMGESEILDEVDC